MNKQDIKELKGLDIMELIEIIELQQEHIRTLEQLLVRKDKSINDYIKQYSNNTRAF